MPGENDEDEISVHELQANPNRTEAAQHWVDALSFGNAHFPQTNRAIDTLVMRAVIEDLTAGRTTMANFFNSDLTPIHIKQLRDSVSALDNRYQIGHDVHPGFTDDRLQELWFVSKLSTAQALLRLQKQLTGVDDFATDEFITTYKDGKEFRAAINLLRREDALLRSPAAMDMSQEYKDHIATFWKDRKPDERFGRSEGHGRFVSRIEDLMRTGMDPNDDIQAQSAILNTLIRTPVA